MATIALRAPLRQRVGASTVDAEGETVAEVLRDLEARSPAIKGWVLDEQGEVRRHVNVFLNGEPASEQDPVGRDDRIDIIHAITGG